MSKWILGIDEVGRGCLAGPVLLGGVLIPPQYPINTFYHESLGYEKYEDLKMVRDSKKLSEIKRSNVAGLVGKYNFFSQLLHCTNAQIDEYGIGFCLSVMVSLLIGWTLTATDCDSVKVIIDGKIKILENVNLELCREILAQSFTDEQELDLLGEFSSFMYQPLFYTKSGLIGLKYCQKQYEIQVIRENKADDTYLSVALASNLAKVSRDSVITHLGKIYPEYNWAQNKGYGTLAHRNAIKKYPDNEYLRKSFLSRVLILDK